MGLWQARMQASLRSLHKFGSALARHACFFILGQPIGPPVYATVISLIDTCAGLGVLGMILSLTGFAAAWLFSRGKRIV